MSLSDYEREMRRSLAELAACERYLRLRWRANCAEMRALCLDLRAEAACPWHSGFQAEIRWSYACRVVDARRFVHSAHSNWQQALENLRYGQRQQREYRAERRTIKRLYARAGIPVGAGS